MLFSVDGKDQRFKLKDSAISGTKQQYQLNGLDRLSPAEQEMDDGESLPEVKREDACVTVEEGNGRGHS